MRWINTDDAFIPHLAAMLKVVPTSGTAQVSEFQDLLPIAGVLFDGFNTQSVHAHIWIHSDHRPSRVFWWAVCDYAFKQCGVQNVVGTVPASNEAALKLNARLGFRECGRIPAYYPDGDDMVVMVCTPETVFDYQRLKPKVLPQNPVTIAA